MLGSSGSVARLPAEAAGLGRLRFRGDLCDLPRNGLGVPQGRCHCFCSGITGVGFSSLLFTDETSAASFLGREWRV